MTNGGHPHTTGPTKKKAAKKAKGKSETTEKSKKWTATSIPKK